MRGYERFIGRANSRTYHVGALVQSGPVQCGQVRYGSPRFTADQSSLARSDPTLPVMSSPSPAQPGPARSGSIPPSPVQSGEVRVNFHPQAIPPPFGKSRLRQPELDHSYLGRVYRHLLCSQRYVRATRVGKATVRRDEPAGTSPPPLRPASENGGRSPVLVVPARAQNEACMRREAGGENARRGVGWDREERKIVMLYMYETNATKLFTRHKCIDTLAQRAFIYRIGS